MNSKDVAENGRDLAETLTSTSLGYKKPNDEYPAIAWGVVIAINIVFLVFDFDRDVVFFGSILVGMGYFFWQRRRSRIWYKTFDGYLKKLD